MRFIPLLQAAGPLRKGELDSDWLASAASLTAQLANAPNKATRDEILNANVNAIWKQIRDWLLTLSHNKCWFSEADDRFSYRDVEHFRPKVSCKRRVGQRRTSYDDGYWWLAYEWKNLRICGNVGNIKKGVFFPLLPHSPVSTYDGLQFANECPVLLDPTSPADPPLLDFNATGEAVPHLDANPTDELRVKITVKYLRLDFDKLEEARAKVWIQCHLLIEQCRDIAATVPFGPAERARVEEKREQLRAMIRPEAPFSMAAAACLRKSGISWAAVLATGA